MSCSPFDLRDYFLQELPPAQRAQVEVHVNQCLHCREELERLHLTGAALCSLREEEIPQRIAFVSDPVFEPSPLRRWWSAFWGSGARLGFASSAMLSASLVFFAATRSATGPVPAPTPTAPPVVAAATSTPQQIQQQIQQAVTRAVADVEAHQAETNRQLVADFEQRERKYDEALRSIRWTIDESDTARKHNQIIRKTAYVQPEENAEVK